MGYSLHSLFQQLMAVYIIDSDNTALLSFVVQCIIMSSVHYTNKNGIIDCYTLFIFLFSALFYWSSLHCHQTNVEQTCLTNDAQHSFGTQQKILEIFYKLVSKLFRIFVTFNCLLILKCFSPHDSHYHKKCANTVCHIIVCLFLLKRLLFTKNCSNQSDSKGESDLHKKCHLSIVKRDITSRLNKIAYVIVAFYCFSQTQNALNISQCVTDQCMRFYPKHKTCISPHHCICAIEYYLYSFLFCVATLKYLYFCTENIQNGSNTLQLLSSSNYTHSYLYQ